MKPDINPVPGAQPPRKRKGAIKIILTVVVLAVLFVGGYFLYMKVIAVNGTVKGPSSNPFSLKKADGWTQLSNKQIAALPGPPLVVLKRQGQGLLIVRKSGKISPNLNKLFGNLANKLKKRVPDFQETASKVVKIKSGTAYLYSYIRKSRGTVNTIVLVPASNSSFTINTVSQGGANDTAKQIGQMIVSFKAG